VSLIQDGAVSAVSDVLKSSIPAAVSPFMSPELREMAARKALVDLERKGWHLIGDAEYRQLQGAQNDLRSITLALADGARELRGMSEMVERRILRREGTANGG
jgi:hypothetical protein